MLESRGRSWSRDISRPIFDNLGLGLGLEGSGLVNIPAWDTIIIIVYYAEAAVQYTQ